MIQIRRCAGFDELDACVQLEIEVWGMDASEIFPRKAFLLAQKIGGQVIAAFDTDLAEPGTKSLIGFVLSWPGIKSGSDGPQPYLHSHMLAVREAYRNHGLGARLKREQRLEALHRGIRAMEWTFDPLEIKNAHLNIRKLGAVARRYEVDFYGVSSSRLQGGLPTDRLVAEWQLDSPRVEAALEDRPMAAPVVEERISVPAAIYQWKSSQAGRESALMLQLENRRLFQQAFSQGLAVVGFSRDAQGNGVFELASHTRAQVGLKP
ncbi:MAG: GNAT family N-acetyltransferase [Terracidiphilus sp.]|jgi:predicted GNAT superfamily acetyltransferase